MITLDLLLDTLPDALVGDVAHKRLRLIGDQLPDALAGAIGLEVRLPDDAQVDLGLHVGTERELDVLAGTDPNVRLAPELRTHPAWRGAARLAQRSLRMMRFQDPLSPAIWLEFDADPARFVPPAPGLFANAAPDPATADDWDVPGTVAAILDTATEGCAPGLDERIGRFAAAGILVHSVGFFPGRPGVAVRLRCALEPALRQSADLPRRLAGALADCGWSGPEEALARWARTCGYWADDLHLSLDVTVAGVLPGVGIEAAPAGRRQPREDPRWGGLLEELAAEGLCTPAKLAAVQELGGGYEGHIFYRRRYRHWLDHLKVTVDAEGAASAKAYLCAREVTS